VAYFNLVGKIPDRCVSFHSSTFKANLDAIIVQVNYEEMTIPKQLHVPQGNPLHTSSGKHTSG
jgi:hypothetical protein